MARASDAETAIVRERQDAVLVHDEASVDDKPRRNGPDLRQKERIAHVKRREVGRRKRKSRKLRLARQHRVANGLVRAVDEAELSKGCLHRRRTRQAEYDVVYLREHGSRIRPVRGNPFDLQLTAHRVLDELEEGTAFLLDERKEDRLRDIRARRPERMDVGEARRVGNGKNMPLAVEQHRKVQRVAGRYVGRAENGGIFAQPTGHRPCRRIEKRLRRGVRPLRKHGKDFMRFHWIFPSSVRLQRRRG